ncbi:MAG: V-type ATP synthase subunit B [Pseudomonadota bacterium]|uniref:V-type ATP synthase beta chain n=1 Tax=anaerobic digester metagenome TaxID=1263854 RepID=A0A485M0A1_9ZZZZ|nr:V-type ATP synthase subunit B [Pseudomonadota bacterium]HON38361.1 V-type ATP synthase subunit B [Deltaproteobacteria bacterium]
MDSMQLFTRQTKAISTARRSLLIIESIPGIRYNEIVDVELGTGEIRSGQVIEVGKDTTVVQVFGGVSEVDLLNSKVRYKGETLKLPVSPDILGRIFDGSGKPIDGGPPIISQKYQDINGVPANPASRMPPAEFIETGISAIDGLNVLVRGQKLPIFSGSGLPHNKIAAQIIRQASLKGKSEDFAIVFGAIGVSYDDAAHFISNLEETGALSRAVGFINTASSPVIERLSTPRLALTAAEYLAWEMNMHVLVILTDITNYADALRELAAMRGEIPSRRGYPGYMYTDLASLYERAGRISGREGSVTIIPILTMPDDDITHPIPDLTGYITEGQIVLSRPLDRKRIYPPIDVFLSLSRMMKEGIGEGKTREDHNNVFMQSYAMYAEGNYLREITTVIGSEALTDRDKVYLNAADRFEREFIAQDENSRRTVEETLSIAWDIFSMLPEEDLKLINEAYIKKYLPEPSRSE